MLLRYLAAYISMRLDGAGPLGARQYAINMVAAHRRARIETRGRL
jgi:hypothetical protein